MADFDPYLKWLGIRESSRPINHYRLLGLDLFEDDADVIAMAADRQMSHIRTYQGGPNGDLSQQLLNELARARRCLLMAEKKQEYDAELRLAQSSAVPMAPVAVPPAIPPALSQPGQGAAHGSPEPAVAVAVVPGSSDLRSAVPLSGEDTIDIQSAAHSMADAKKREFKKLLLLGFAWLSGGVGAVGVAAAIISSGILGTQPQKEPAEEGGGLEVTAVAAEPTGLPASPVVEAEIPKVGSKKAGGPKADSPKVDSPEDNARASEVVSGGDSDVVKPAVESVKLPPATEPRYTLKNLVGYPKQVPSLMGVFGEAKRCIVEKKISLLGPTPLSSDQVIEVIPDGGAIVIGLSLATDQKGRVLSICPVYHTGFRAFAGDAFGRDGSDPSVAAEGESVLFLAKPGYALAGLEFSKAEPSQGCRANFMKISGNTLDPEDEYSSEWLGGKSALKQVVGNPQGLPVVGLSASFEPSGALSRLSLFAMDATAESVPKKPDSSLASDGLPGFFEEKPEMSSSDRADSKPEGDEAVEPIVKLLRPDSRTRAKSKKKIAGLLQSIENGARTASDRRSAAKELIEDAITEEDFVVRYILWMKAVELGEDSGDAIAVVDAMRLLDQYYEIDFWKEVLESLDSAARNVSSRTVRDFKRTTDALIREAEEQGRYEIAVKYLSFAIRQSKKVKDSESLDEYQAIEKRVKKFRDLSTGNQKAIAVLVSNPEDPLANLNRGDFLFVIEDDFENAIPHWQNSEDVKLLSMLDLHAELGSKNREEILPLADALAKLGEAARSPRDLKFLARALAIYKKSVRSLSGLEKQSVNQKIDAIKQKLENR